jgi:hypothetical protein
MSGTVSCRRRPAALAQVLITEREIVSGAERTFSTATDEFGGWRIGITPEANATYSVEVADPLLSGARAGGHEVRARVAVTMVVERDRVPAGTPVSIHGRVTPAHPGVPVIRIPKTRCIEMDRLSRGHGRDGGRLLDAVSASGRRDLGASGARPDHRGPRPRFRR